MTSLHVPATSIIITLAEGSAMIEPMEKKIMERKQPSPFNAEWLATFFRVCAEEGSEAGEIQSPTMPTSKDVPQSFIMRSACWLNEDLFPPYYANRDVSKRLNREHLSGISEFAQLQVVAVFFNGGLIKIDGHSRAAAWFNKQLEMPRFVKVLVFKADSWDEVARIYNQYNSGASAATPKERTDHANKLAAFEPKNIATLSGWSTVFARINPKYQGKEALATVELKPYLEIMDSWEIAYKGKKHMFPIGIKLAMLKSVMRYGEAIKPFWMVYADNDNHSIYPLSKARDEILAYKGKMTGQAVINYFSDMFGDVVREYAEENAIKVVKQ